MEQSYEVGSGNNIISLTVTVGTVGVSYTEFSMVKGIESSGVVANSLPENYNIENTELGTAAEVQDSSVVILTLISLFHLTEAQRERAIETLIIDYELFGGSFEKGTYSFDNNTDLVITPNKKIISVTTKIDLV